MPLSDLRHLHLRDHHVGPIPTVSRLLERLEDCIVGNGAAPHRSMKGGRENAGTAEDGAVKDRTTNAGT